MREDDVRRQLLDLSRTIDTMDAAQPETPQPPRFPARLAIALGVTLGLLAFLILMLIPT